jgi:hypothetical protein
VLSFVVLSFSFFRLCNILPKSTFSFSFFISSSICTNMLKSFIASLSIAAVVAVDWAATSSTRRALVAFMWAAAGLPLGSLAFLFIVQVFFLPVSALARNFLLVIFPLRPTWLCLESFSVRRRPRIVRCLPGVLDRNYCNGSFFGRPHFRHRVSPKQFEAAWPQV